MYNASELNPNQLRQLITHHQSDYSTVALHRTADLHIPVHVQLPFLEDQ